MQTLRIAHIFFAFCITSRMVQYIHCTPIDNGVEGDPEIECGPSTITVNFNTRNNFEGHVFVKGRYNEPSCRTDQSGKKVASLSLPFTTCGVDRQRSLNPRGIFIGVSVVITFHPQFLTKVDRAYSVQCFYMESDKTVSQELDVSEITTAFQTQVVPMPICRYDILDGGPNGEPIKFASIGQMVYHKWTCETEAVDIFCMVVHSCFVDDGAANRIQLLNEQGCALDKFLVNNLEYISDLMAGKESHVFKFADKPALLFQCQISIAIKEPEEQCPRPQCPEAGGPVAGGTNIAPAGPPATPAARTSPPTATSPKAKASPSAVPPSKPAISPSSPAQTPIPQKSPELAVIAPASRSAPAPAQFIPLSRTPPKASTPVPKAPRRQNKTTTAAPDSRNRGQTSFSTRATTGSTAASSTLRPPSTTAQSQAAFSTTQSSVASANSQTQSAPNFVNTVSLAWTSTSTIGLSSSISSSSGPLGQAGDTVTASGRPIVGAVPAALPPSPPAAPAAQGGSAAAVPPIIPVAPVVAPAVPSASLAGPSVASAPALAPAPPPPPPATSIISQAGNGRPGDDAKRFGFESTFPFRLRRVRRSFEQMEQAGTWDVRAQPISTFEDFDNDLSAADSLSSMRGKSHIKLVGQASGYISDELYCVPTLLVGLVVAITVLSLLVSIFVALLFCLRRRAPKYYAD